MDWDWNKPFGTRHTCLNVKLARYFHFEHTNNNNNSNSTAASKFRSPSFLHHQPTKDNTTMTDFSTSQEGVGCKLWWYLAESLQCGTGQYTVTHVSHRQFLHSQLCSFLVTKCWHFYVKPSHTQVEEKTLSWAFDWQEIDSLCRYLVHATAAYIWNVIMCDVSIVLPPS